MKKTFSKLFALTMALVMLLSLALSASAKETYEIKPMEELGSESLTSSGMDICLASGGTQNAAEFSAADKAGVFVLRLSKGTDMHTIGAFLVENGGRTYLLTHYVAAVYAADGYELTLMIPGGENMEAVCVAYDENYHVAYLYAPGMQYQNPVQYKPKEFSNTIAVGLGYTDKEVTKAMRIEYDVFDVSKWTRLTEYCYAYDQEMVWNWFGSPVFPNTKDYDLQGMGTVVENGSGDLMIAVMSFEDMTLVDTFSLVAIENGSLNTQEEPQPAPQPDPEPDPAPAPQPDSDVIDPKYLIIGGIIAVVVAYYIYNNRRKDDKKSKAVTAAAPVPMNLPLDPTIPVEPERTHAKTRAVSDWQLRSMGGALGDKVFPIGGTVRLGRSSKADIRFPDSTPGISGSHCELTVSGDRVILRDVGSSYGTYVGESKLSPNTDHTLYAGDKFTLSKNGPTFRLEKIGTSGDKSEGPAVRDIQGKNHRAGGNAKLTFGRKSGNNVQVSDDAVSSAHCVLYREGGKLYLKDLESVNGTFFNEKERLKPNTPYRVSKGMSFFLSSPKNTFVVTEE